jgi:hypothetical protein
MKSNCRSLAQPAPNNCRSLAALGMTNAVLGMTAMTALLLAQPAAAQTAGELHLRRLLSVPLGALPPQAMLMPASRNHNYWVGRLQAGTQRNNLVGDLSAVAAGLDLQWRGGSVLGLTGGYQSASCKPSVVGCEGHALFGVHARANVITGGPTFASIVGDNSATTTVGMDLSYGYAPNAISGLNACAVDVGMPISISVFQRVRVLTFFTPGMAWDVRCLARGSVGTGVSTLASAGIGIQQLGNRGLDVSIGTQRIFRRGSGIQLGINVTYVRLP